MVDSTSLMSRQNGGLGRLFNQIYVAAAKERQGPGYFDGSERNLRNLFEVAGFEDVETLTETPAKSLKATLVVARTSSAASTTGR
jgi:hypothetical protein